MTALVLDAGAFVAVDRDDRDMIARLEAARRHGMDLRTNPMVLAQVWRDGRGRRVKLARMLRAVDVRPLDDADGRAAGVLLGRSGTSDPIDASVALMAGAGDRIVTSAPDDLQVLVDTAGRRAVIVRC